MHLVSGDSTGEGGDHHKDESTDVVLETTPMEPNEENGGEDEGVDE